MPDDAPTRTGVPPAPAATRTAGPPSPSAPTATDSPQAPTAEPRPEAVGRFVLLGELARGGMGVVYRAHDPAIDREVAVKLLAERLADRPEAVRRFRDEARVMGQLQHPGIPPVHEVGELPDGRPFLAMKLIKGRTLDDLLKERRDPLADRGRFVAHFEQVCQAVAYAHNHGVIHRDLKPANVMVGAFGEVQVMDWGLAKVLGTPEREAAGPDEATTEIRSLRDSDSSFTQAGSVLGTPAFMPPEQAGGEVAKIDRRSDVFGLGAILCVILTGKPPYVGPDSDAVRLMAIRGELGDALARLDGCGAEPELVALAKQCLAREATARPSDANAVAKTVETLRTEAEARARRAELERATAEAQAGEQRKRRRLARVLSAAIVLALAAGTAATFVKYRDEAAQRSIADDERKTAEEHLKTAQAESQAKDEALQRLTEQQRITEEALLLGLLRPLRNKSDATGYRLTADEQRALRDLGALTDERLRFRFVELALSTTDGPRKLAFRALTVIHALVGWDGGRAARLRSAINNWLVAGIGGQAGQIACIELLLALPPGEPAHEVVAIEILIDCLTDLGYPFGATSQGTLSTLLSRQRPDQAARLAALRCHRIAVRVAQETLPPKQQALAQIWSVLATRLERAEATNQASTMARAVAAQVTSETKPQTLHLLASTLDLLVAHLGTADAAAIVQAPAETTLKRVLATSELSSPDSTQLLIGFHFLGRHLDPASATQAVQSLANRLHEALKTNPAQQHVVEGIVYALVPVLHRLPQHEAHAIAEPIARDLSRKLTDEPNAGVVRTAAYHFDLVLSLVSRGDAAAIARPVVQAFSQRMLRGNPIDALTATPQFFSLLPFLDEQDLKAVLSKTALPLAKQLRDPAGVYLLVYLSVTAASTLASQLTPEEVADLVRSLFARAESTLIVEPRMYLGAIFLFALHLKPEVVTPIVRTYSDQLAKESHPERAEGLVEILATMSRWQSDGDLVGLVKTYGGQPGIALQVLAEFNRRLGRLGSAPTQTLAGTALGHTPPFASVWELVAWAEANRPDLDFRSPPAKTP